MNRLNITHYLIASLILISMPASSLAEEVRKRDYKPGMKHTYVRKYDAPPQTPYTAEKNETVTEVKDTVGGEDVDETKVETAPGKPAAEVWKKYKELAGLPTEEAAEENNSPQAPEKPVLPEIATAKAKMQERRDNRQGAQPKQTGFAAIINDYRISKERRSQVRSIQISKPSPPKVEKPTVTN